MAKLNEAQASAVHAPLETVIVTAGAGTGKTSVLTHRYIHLVKNSNKDPQEALRDVVAITFTRKATAEMKHRIGAMGRELNLDLSEAQVQTIDSFFLDLVKEYALYLDLDPALEVLDGVELNELLNASVKKVLTEKLHSHEELAELIRRLNVRKDQFETGLITLYQKIRQREDLKQLTSEDLEGTEPLDDEEREVFEKIADPKEYRKFQELILELLHSIDGDFFARKKSRGQLDYTDVLDLALELLEDSKISSDIAGRYPYILIDEFQDTNRRQSEVFKKLFGSGSKLFIVGDGKQSIYGFRGSDLKASEEMHDFLIAGGAYKVVLDKNYRSNKSYLEEINQCFENLFTNYEPLDPQLDNGRTAFISLNNEESELSAQALEAELMAQKILELSKDHELKKIALLFRRSTHMSLYEEALRKRQIPFKNTHGKDFFNQREVMDLMLLLKTIQDPDDKLSYIGLLRSPYVGLMDESIYKLIVSKEPLDYKEQAHFEKMEHLLNKWRKLSQGDSTFYLLSEIFKDTQILDYYQQVVKDVYSVSRLTKILNIALEYDQEAPNGLMGLLAHLENLEAEEKMASDATAENVVTLSTIHGSKGLEYGVVFLPDVNAPLRKTSDLINYTKEYGLSFKINDKDQKYQKNMEILSEREEEELLRLFYVAVTRGKEQLIVGPMDSKSKKELAIWLEGFPFVEEYILPDGKSYDDESSEERLQVKVPKAQLKKPILTATDVLNRQRFESSAKSQTRGHIIGQLIHAYAQELDGQEDGNTLERIMAKSPIQLSDAEVNRLTKLAAHYRNSLKNEEVLARELPFLLELESFYLRGTIDQVRERDGKLYLVDLKTNLSGATAENVDYYAMQLQLYGLAFEELTGKELAGLELIFLEDEGRVSVEKADRVEITGRVLEVIESWRGEVQF